MEWISNSMTKANVFCLFHSCCKSSIYDMAPFFDYINTGCRHDAQPCILDFYSCLFVFSLAVLEPGNLYSSSSYLLWPQPMRDIYFAYHTLPPLPMVWKNMHCPLLGWEWGREIHFFVTSTAKGHKIFVFFFKSTLNYHYLITKITYCRWK